MRTLELRVSGARAHLYFSATCAVQLNRQYVGMYI